MSFDQLLHVSRIGNSMLPHNLLVFDWDEKRQHLAVYLQDLPRLVAEYKLAPKAPYELNPMITLVDPFPKIRLSSSFEAAVNCLYGMAEVAAQFGNKVSSGALPSKFNELRKKTEKIGPISDDLKEWVTDFTWYKKVREIRTEWAHYSTVFVGEETNGEPIIVVRCLRRRSDQEEFHQEVQVQIPDLINWIKRAIGMLDGFGDYLLVKYIIPKLDPNAKFIVPKQDQQGWPIIKSDHTFEAEEITVADYLVRCGIRYVR